MNRTSIGSIAIAGLLALCCVSGASAQTCVADITGDRVVDGSDLANVLAQWGPCGSSESCSADVNDDGAVNGMDLGNVLTAWGFCPVTVPTWAMLVEAQPDPGVIYDANLRSSIIATGYAWRVRDTATQIEMVLIPPGTFQMGCSPSVQYGCSPLEVPVHTVTLTQACYMGRFEVTQAQWTARMGSNPSFFASPSAEVPASQVPYRPVEGVSWNMIQGFLSATGMRLPTEAEWEYSYWAGTTTAFHSMPGYPNGTDDDNQLGQIAWFNGNSWQTRPVGQRAGNGFGLHDMSGNLWEWVNDWWFEDYYASSPSVNPPGPSSGLHRVWRGGSWAGGFGYRSSTRAYSPVGLYGISNVCGFRVVRNP